MTIPSGEAPTTTYTTDQDLSLYHLLDPEVLANPYPLYQRLRREDPVHWDPYLHVWVVTRYADVVAVFQHFSADRTTARSCARLAWPELTRWHPQLVVSQMLFLDPPTHSRIRGLASRAFTPRRVEVLREHIQDITDNLLDAVQTTGHMEALADLGRPLPRS